MLSANDLILFYLGLELQSLALYVLAAIDRDNTISSEAGIKIFCFKRIIFRTSFVWLFIALWIYRIN